MVGTDSGAYNQGSSWSQRYDGEGQVIVVHPTSLHLGFPGDLAVTNLLVMQETASNTGDTGPILGQEGPLEKEMASHSNILAWERQRSPQATVHGVAKSQTRLSD